MALKSKNFRALLHFFNNIKKMPEETEDTECSENSEGVGVRSSPALCPRMRKWRKEIILAHIFPAPNGAFPHLCIPEPSTPLSQSLWSIIDVDVKVEQE